MSNQDGDQPADPETLKKLADAALRRHRGTDRTNTRPTKAQAAAALAAYRRANRKGTP